MTDPVKARTCQADLEWWRSAVVYQVYPRSFADANGDGIGDLRGIIDKLGYLEWLGVDALWISPWYPSPFADGGYDVSDYRGIHPDFGTLAEADELIDKVHETGLRVIIDLVPNHCSDEHPWFRKALAAGPGSAERDLFVFRDGKGPDGSQPPTNWQSQFGGPAWQRVEGPDGPEQWYLHMFDIRQPDWNWEHPAVAEEFDAIIRFWCDRGVDGFRIDVADSMVMDPDLPDVPIDPDTGLATLAKFVGAPHWDQPGLEAVHRRWRKIAEEYADTPQGPRIFVSEAYLSPAERLARYVEPDRLHTTFNFAALECEWSESSLRNVITQCIAAHEAVGAPCTWVLSNHDTPRVVTRYGRPTTGAVFTPEGVAPEDEYLSWDKLADQPCDRALGRRRARAAALLELALPGGAYVYQGDELALEEVEDLPEETLQDPTWERSNRTVRGRDGCRVPMPWSGSEPPYGFGGGTPWLPMPSGWGDRTVAAQESDPASHLSLYRELLAERRRNPELGDGALRWVESAPGVLVFDRGTRFRCLVNFADEPVALPPGSRVVVASGDPRTRHVERDEAVWLELSNP